MNKTLNDITREIHQNAVDHGWWDEPRSFGDIVALCHSELSEALEEYRERRPTLWYKEESVAKLYADERVAETMTRYKPEGIAVEMIDCMIRILDWCGYAGVDVDEVLRIKHEYNKTRPHKHGGKVI